MMSLLDEVRAPLLAEARRSPQLLADLAGLEQYIAESYQGHSFAELLQNADDAGASRFTIQRAGEHLLVANDGRIFSRADFEGLCRSAASNKERGIGIGFRGVGFKSVVGIAENVYLFSGEISAQFSREKTAREIPQASRVPLLRIPHPVTAAERGRFDSGVTRLLRNGFQTVFVFGGLIAAGIESEFSALDPTVLLFLRNVRQLELRTDVEELIKVRREIIDQRTQRTRLTASKVSTTWTIISQDEVALAFAHDNSSFHRVEEQDAVVYAFLPTREPTGLGIKINCDISTDPSRTRVILDDRTRRGIDRVANLIVQLLSESLTPIDSTSNTISVPLVSALIPHSDPRALVFQRRSFKTELLDTIKKAAQGRLRPLRCRPAWLNATDFEKIASAGRVNAVHRQFEGIDGLTGFLHYLGVPDATLDDLSSGISSVSVSLLGCAEIVAYLLNRYSSKQLNLSEVQRGWRVWPVGIAPVSLQEAIRLKKPLDRRFVDIVLERTASRREFSRFIQELADATVANTLFPDDRSTASGDLQLGNAEGVRATESLESATQALSSLLQPISLKRWRSAEQQVLAVLIAQGWQASDVSRQNIGYDIEAHTPQGEARFIEVKLIDFPGQAFTFTSNEEAVARERGTLYIIALLCQKKEAVELALVRDPVNQLKFVRQCRQWVWECSDYDFRPLSFSVSS